MGGIISKRKDSTRKHLKQKKKKSVQETSVEIYDDLESVEHIYMNIDENIADIDSVDGTYYQPIERSHSISHQHRNSIDTTLSDDSAFSDNSNGKQSIFSNNSYHRENPHTDYSDYARAKSVTGRRRPIDISSRRRSYRRDDNGLCYISNSAINTQDNPYDDYASYIRGATSLKRNPSTFSSQRESCYRKDSNGYVSNSDPDARKVNIANRKNHQVFQLRDTNSNEYSGFQKISKKSKQKRPDEICKPGVQDKPDDWKEVCKAPMDRVVFLLEAFEPLITGCLNVMDLVPHLVFIEDIEVFRERHRQSPREAVVHLIKTIKESDEPGKWQAFLEALKVEGYEYIAKLLLEETEEDHAINRKILRLFTPELITRIDPEQFIDHLLEEDLIGETDREEIQCEKRNKGDIAASLLLLERVPRRLENWPDLFIKVLEKCGLQEFVENFRIPEVTIDQISINGGNYYITPCEDEKTLSKMSGRRNPKQWDTSSQFTGDFEYDIDVKQLINERNILERKVMKERELRKLRLQIETLKAELAASGDGDGMASVMTSTTKCDDSDEKTDPNLVENCSNENNNDIPVTESSKNESPRPDGIKDTADNSIPETANHLLLKIASGVESIHDILKEIRDGNKENAMKNQNVQQMNPQNDSVYITNPLPHSFNRSQVSVPKQYLQMRSFDSAISIGYITNNAEQYV